MTTLSSLAPQRRSTRGPLVAATVVGLAVVLGVALWLRWRYLQEISLYVDEFTTLWAAQRILETGGPFMPSGVLYTRGLLATYVTAAFAALGGPSYTVGRLPSLLFGLVTILAVWGLGRREWNVRVAWLAAVGLTLLPEAIVWSARARFYAQLQFFVLLTAWAAYVLVREYGVPASARPRFFVRWAPWLFAFLFVVALFSQEETILLYPPILLAMLLWRGGRFLLRPAVLAANLLCLVAMGLRYLVEIQGQPGYFETIQAQRPYVGMILDWSGAWATYDQLLVSLDRLPWTLFGIVAVAVAVWSLAQVRGQLLTLPGFHQATLFFALQFVAVFVFILLLVGGTWREARYLYLVQPFWMLVGAAGMVWAIERFLRGARARGVATGAVATLLIALQWPAGTAVLAQQVEGYDRVLAYVAAERRPDDVIMTPQPPACALALGPCDYYAVQRGYEEYVIPDAAGVPVDRWSGARLLANAGQLAEVIRTAPRVWFITDGFRLATRYDEAFLRTVVEQFDSAFEERGVMALQASGWRTPPAAEVEETLTPTVRFGPLELLSWSRTAAAPGADLGVTLTWRGAEPIDRQYNTSVQIVDQAGERVAQADGPPARGLIPTNLFFATPLPDPKSMPLPAELPPGRYRFDVAAYDVETLTPVGPPYPVGWFRVGPAPEEPAVLAEIPWQDNLTLVGYDTLRPMLTAGDTLDLRLVWTAAGSPSADYTAFVHLLGPDGTLVAQSDAPPGGAFYPTSGWEAGERVEDRRTLALPADLAPGEYRLVAGFYQPATGARLPLAAGGDTVELGVMTAE